VSTHANVIILRVTNVTRYFIAKIPLVDRLVRSIVIKLLKANFRARHRHMPFSENSFLFECFKGKMVNDSPFAIYKKLLLKYPEAEFTWVVSSLDHPMSSVLNQNRNTSVVSYGSDEYFRAYALSKFWIVNCRISPKIAKRAGQILVQCWHGTPLKKIGLDIQSDGNKKVSKASLRASYSSESRLIDFFISPSPYASKCFRSGFGLKSDQILEVGYPRNDELLLRSSDKQLIERIKKSFDIPSDKTVILYAPTWRDDSFSPHSATHVFRNPLLEEGFINKFGEDCYFLYRTHYFTDPNDAPSRFIDVSKYNNINNLFLISDLLITDYSSVFFDYALLDKPILFFMYDREEYESNIRGVYFSDDNCFPGTISTCLGDLAGRINEALNEKTDLKRFNNIFNPYEDGCSTERVVNAIGKELNYRVRI
jgi:CDP-glycerol glycerophosphotransferase (TagB/SpsB family)